MEPPDRASDIAGELLKQADRLQALGEDYQKDANDRPDLAMRAPGKNICVRQSKDVSKFNRGTDTLASRGGRVVRGKGNFVIGRSAINYYDGHAFVPDWGTWGKSLKLGTVLSEADSLPAIAIPPQGAHGVVLHGDETIAFFRRYLGGGNVDAPRAKALTELRLEIIEVNPRTGTRTYVINGIDLGYSPVAEPWQSFTELVDETRYAMNSLRLLAKTVGSLERKRQRTEEKEREWKYPRRNEHSGDVTIAKK